ncbi:MAG: DUF2892 domain-containing protein [Candidatus Anstonellales archaeon]
MNYMHNVGISERILRFTIGLFLFLITMGKAAELPSWSFGLLVIISLALVLTGLFGYCPVYAAVGRNTCEECAKYEKGEEHKKEEVEGQPLIEEKLEEVKAEKQKKKAKKVKRAKRSKK